MAETQEVGTEAELMLEKPNRLQGICAEILFAQKLVIPAFKQLSDSWWFGQNTAHKWLGSQPLGLSGMDILIGRYMGEHMRTVFAHSRSDNWYASCAKSPDPIESMRSAKKRGALRPIKTSEKFDDERWKCEEAIKWMERNGVDLDQVLLERKFSWSIGYGSRDVDGLTMVGKQPVMFEFKQKFPKKNGRFGMNKVAANHLVELSQIMPVIHVILTKPHHSKNLSAISQFKPQAEWQMCEITDGFAYQSVHHSPAYTTMSGRGKLKYLEISAEMCNIGSLNDTDAPTNFRERVEEIVHGWKQRKESSR